VHHLQWQGNPQLQQQGIIPVHRIPYTKQPPEEIRSGCFAFYIIYHNSSLEMSDEPNILGIRHFPLQLSNNLLDNCVISFHPSRFM
jgi:hypothetical protein